MHLKLIWNTWTSSFMIDRDKKKLFIYLNSWKIHARPPNCGFRRLDKLERLFEVFS